MFFFCFWFEKEEGKWLNSGGRERKSWLRPILAIKIGDFGFNRFLLMNRVRQGVVFSLNLHEMMD